MIISRAITLATKINSRRMEKSYKEEKSSLDGKINPKDHSVDVTGE
jgi:hypothetical protein